METEINLLSKIDHPNIIKVHGKSASVTKASECTEESARDFFIVVGRLSGTLTDKIEHWKREKERMDSKLFYWFVDHSEVVKRHELLMEPLRIALNVASSLAYLHEKGIIYRDLKADNVGFDFDGKCKLFDFGLARRLPRDPKMKQMNDTYIMSGKTGSLMFMAPEVYNEKPYNHKADVYSMAMLLWEMLSLELPYLEYIYDPSVFQSEVMQRGTRPTIPSKWPVKIQILLKRAWSKDMDERPTMQEVCVMLREAIASVQTLFDFNNQNIGFGLQNSGYGLQNSSVGPDMKNKSVHCVDKSFPAPRRISSV